MSGASSAVSAVGIAVKKGLLPDLKKETIKCSDCDDKATQYDHRDYNYKLFVQPVCMSCNRKRGAAKHIKA